MFQYFIDSVFMNKTKCDSIILVITVYYNLVNANVCNFCEIFYQIQTITLLRQLLLILYCKHFTITNKLRQNWIGVKKDT